jgi:hypothetical protein
MVLPDPVPMMAMSKWSISQNLSSVVSGCAVSS